MGMELKIIMLSEINHTEKTDMISQKSTEWQLAEKGESKGMRDRERLINGLHFVKNRNFWCDKHDDMPLILELQMLKQIDPYALETNWSYVMRPSLKMKQAFESFHQKVNLIEDNSLT